MLRAARDELLGKAYGNPKILYAMMEGLAEAPQPRLLIDRDKARAQGVRFETISSALSGAFGWSDFANAGRQQRGVVQAERAERMTPERVLELRMPNDDGEPAPPASAPSAPAWSAGCSARRCSG